MFRNYSNYEVFSDGRIYSYKTKKFLKPQTQKNGYQQIQLSDNDGNKKRYYLHRVVYESVTGSPIPENLECNHIDENKENNNISNLNLMTPKQNMNWGTRNDRASKAMINGKLSKQVGAFNKNGELVMAFKSIQDCGRNGFDPGAVCACCNGKRKNHKGYSWRYI